jgi:hypothetical protein
MSIDTENQQVVVALMEEEEKPSSTKVKKTPGSKKNYCSEEYLVPIGVPVAIVLLIILLLVVVIIGVRKYNQNCAPTKGTSCRGVWWYFT